jgi:two-component system cell cycle sensor histidine kinase/response regulator CckA
MDPQQSRAEVRSGALSAQERVAFHIEATGVLVALGAGWSALTGFGVEECLGTSLFDYVHPDDRPRLSALLDRLAGRAMDSLTSQVRCLTKANDVRLVDIFAQLVLGESPMIVGVLTDSTDVHRTSCHAADERHVDAELHRAQKMEAMGLLAGGIAHDFNNLLTVISGRCQILRRRVASDARIVGELDLIVAATQRATNLTRQLLIFGRRQAMAPRVLDLGEIVVGLEKMLRRLIGEDVELIITAEAGRSHVKADASQLEQVLMNLVVNARDAMPTGGRLAIDLVDVVLSETAARQHPGLRSGPYVALSVTDTGCGIAREIIPRIFEPFFTTKGERGSGLGLATVYSLVDQAGGCVEVESDLGQGTTFRVLLPSVEGEARTTEPPPEAGCSNGTETLLLAEDEENVRALAVEIFRQGGYTVLEACDGLDALDVARRHTGPIDLLVTDVIMPRMGGAELAQELRVERPDVEVLFVSGYTADRLKDHGVPGRPIVLLSKPYTAATLLQKTRELLDATLRRRHAGP